MRHFLPRFFLFWAMLLVGFAGNGCEGRIAPPTANKGSMDLTKWDFKDHGPVTLDGQWRFYWKKTREDLGAENKTPRPMMVRVPADWTNYRRADGSSPGSFGFAVYRLEFKLARPMQLSVKMLDAATSYNLYVNGTLLLKNGRVGRTDKTTISRFLPQVSERIKLGEHNEMILEVANFSHRKGGIWESIRLGRREDLRRIRDVRIWLDLFVAGSLFIMAFYHLGLYALRRTDPTALLFGLFCVVMGVRLLVVGERALFAVWPEFDWSLGVRLAYIAAYTSGLPFIYYMRGLFPDELGKRWALVFTGPLFALSLLVLVLPMHLYSRTLLVWHLVIAVAIVWVLSALVLAVIRRREGAGTALLGAVPLLATAINDSLYSDLVINTGYIGHYGLFAFIFIQAFLLSRRFSGAFALSEALSNDLRASNRRLVSLDKLKDEFLANTSHELRTPLHGIIGITESLRAGIAGTLPGEAVRQLRLVASSGRNLATLVNDILDLSRLKHSDIVLNKKPLNLRPIVDVVLELNAISAASAGLRPENTIPPDLPPVLADENRLQQILHNLVGNAIKFTPAGSVVVSAERAGPLMLEISVADTGPGVPPEKREEIFVSFEQLDSGADRAHGGAGLGLSITRALVELHGGRIRVESTAAEASSGARFVFSMPIAPTPASNSREDTGADGIDESDQTGRVIPPDAGPVLHEENRSIASEGGEGTPRIRILIVDDEIVNLQVLANYVELQHWQAVTATSGAEALEILKRDASIDAVVLDLMMPRMSGFETARRIRKQYGLLELPILMLTARNQTEDLVAGLHAGANDYLVKPVERDEAVLRLSNLVNMRKAHLEGSTTRRRVVEAIRHERRKFNENLHDHLGAQLVDMRFLVREIAANTRDNPEPARRLEEQVKNTTAMLRDQMLFNEDLDLLSENFREGINLILLRRYTSADRELHFTGQGAGAFEEGLSESLKAGLYAVTKEIATNDLKYGEGMTSWSLGREHDQGRTFIVVVMEAQTRYSLEKDGVGMGTQNLTRRMAELDGSLNVQLENGRITIALRAPLA